MVVESGKSSKQQKNAGKGKKNTKVKSPAKIKVSKSPKRGTNPVKPANGAKNIKADQIVISFVNSQANGASTVSSSGNGRKNPPKQQQQKQKQQLKQKLGVQMSKSTGRAFTKSKVQDVTQRKRATKALNRSLQGRNDLMQRRREVSPSPRFQPGNKNPKKTNNNNNGNSNSNAKKSNRTNASVGSGGPVQIKFPTANGIQVRKVKV
jgi:hypothetical protein